jgi:hypothetical protein
LKTGLKILFHSAAVMFLAACLSVVGCGDKGLRLVPEAETVQGVWEGNMRLSANGDSTLQESRLRLEFVQRDFLFDGYLLRTDPLAASFGVARVDTFLVNSGSISTSFVSFRAVTQDGSGTPAVFEGQLSGENLSGTVVGGGFLGRWEVRFLY